MFGMPEKKTSNNSYGKKNKSLRMRYELVGRGFKKCSRDIKLLQRLAKSLTVHWEIHVILPSKMRMKTFDRFKDSVMKIIIEELDRGHSAKALTSKYHCSLEHLNLQIRKYKKSLVDSETLLHS